MEIGQANYSTGNKTTIAKIKDGDNIYRILPPLGSMAKEGKWNRFISVEWGYRDLKGNNRPFQDVRVVNYRTGMVEVESAAHLKREEVSREYKQVVDLYKSGKASQNDVAEAKKRTEQFNLDKKYYLNAINLKGEIVLLKIGHKAKQGLDLEIKKLRDKGVDPLSLDNGRFFNINRTGTGLSTIYGVTVASESIDVEGIGRVQKELVHKIDDSIIRRLSNEATDLGTLDKLYVVVTADQVRRMVEGGPAAVTSILGDRDAKGQDLSGNEDGGGEQEVQSSNLNLSSNSGSLNNNLNSVVNNNSNLDGVVSSPVIAKVEESPVKENLAAAAPVSSAALDKEEFLKSLGL